MTASHELPDDLINGFLRQSYAGAVRQRLLVIERAVQSGQRHEHIVRGLEESGMHASMSTFRKSLSRARIWWRKQLLMQMAQNQAQQQAAAAQGVDSHPNARQSAVVMPKPAMPPEATRGISEGRRVLRPRAPAVAGRVDLDQFFKPKSVFSKT